MFPANGWRERDAEGKKKMSEMGAEENALKSKLLKKKNWVWIWSVMMKNQVELIKEESFFLGVFKWFGRVKKKKRIL